MPALSIDSARLSVCAQDACAVEPRVDPRIRLRHRLLASRFNKAEHPDEFTQGWNAGIEYAIGAAIDILFPLPTPVYSCRVNE